MNGGVEFPDETDETLDPVLVRDYAQLSLPVLPGMLVRFGIVKNIDQANKVLAGLTVACMTITFAVVANAFVGDRGELDKYPAQDVSRGV